MRKKIIAIFLFSFLLTISMTGCKGLFDDSHSREEIIAYVNENIEKIKTYEYDKAPKNNKEEERYIRQELGSYTIVKDVYLNNDNILEFSCGGTGLSTNSTYSGFYFSKDNTPYGMDFAGCELIEEEPGVFIWQNEDGSHKIYTERIMDNWFYYFEQYY